MSGEKTVCSPIPKDHIFGDMHLSMYRIPQEPVNKENTDKNNPAPWVKPHQCSPYGHGKHKHRKNIDEKNFQILLSTGRIGFVIKFTVPLCMMTNGMRFENFNKIRQKAVYPLRKTLLMHEMFMNKIFEY